MGLLLGAVDAPDGQGGPHRTGTGTSARNVPRCHPAGAQRPKDLRQSQGPSVPGRSFAGASRLLWMTLAHATPTVIQREPEATEGFGRDRGGPFVQPQGLSCEAGCFTTAALAVAPLATGTAPDAERSRSARDVAL